jgi:ribosomal protein S18 acetylase RimI-like enzyme
MIIYQPTIEEIRDFFLKNEKNQVNFRYFKTRDFSIIKNHIKTILLKDNNKIVGYGHLDKDENNQIWLGIMVCDDCIGRGYGKKMMAELLINQKDSIKLSVDIENNIAKKLYEKNGFVVIETKPRFYIMEKNNRIL